MKTLAVMHIAEPGGPPRTLRPWLASLRRQGPVEIATPGEGGVTALYGDFDGLHVLDYGSLVLPRGARAASVQARRFVAEVRLFRRLIRSVGPDLVVVVTSTLPAVLIAARLEGVPRLTYVAEIFDKRFVRGHVRSAASLALARFVSSFSNAIVCCSHTVAAQFHGTKRAPVVTIYPGVEPAPPGSGPAFRRRENLVDANPLLAVIGNISRGRGQDLIVRALPAIRERFPGTRCVIAGAPHQRPVDLAYRQELAALVDQLGQADSVVFVGFVDPISDVYAAADIVVNPARFNEPFGRVAIEALSAGTPVVAARVGAIAEVLLDGVGALLVEPDDPDRLAEAVTKLWADQGLRTSLVERGRKDVERRFDVEASVAQFEAVVSTLVSDG